MTSFLVRFIATTTAISPTIIAKITTTTTATTTTTTTTSTPTNPTSSIKPFKINPSHPTS